MTTQQFQAAVALAASDADLSHADDSVLFGFGLPNFKPVVATLQAIARTIRWQALQLNGQFDSEALNECHQLFRHRVTVV